MSDITRFPMLDEAQRIQAEQIARGNILARDPEPLRSQYQRRTIGKYSPAFEAVMVAFVGVLFLVGFGPSAFRVYHKAYSTFMAGGEFNATQGMITGGSFVLLAEIAMVLFAMTAGVLSVSRRMRRLLYSASLLSAFMAVVGNVQVAIDYDSTQPFDWLVSLIKTLAYNPFAGLEAALPPVFTLIGGLVLKELALSAMGRRHENERAYQLDFAAWQERAKAVEDHPTWTTQKASAIRQVYQMTHGRKAVVKDGVTDEEWRAIVAREMLHGAWFDEEDLAAYNPVDRPLSSPRPEFGFVPLARKPERD